MKGKAVSLILCLLLSAWISLTCYCESSEAAVNSAPPAESTASPDTAGEESGAATVNPEEYKPLPMVYDVETGMYIYSLGGGTFWCSEELAAAEIQTSAFWIGTESFDVEIKITCDGEPYAYSPTSVLDMVGSYKVYVSYQPEGGEAASAEYGISIVPLEEIVPEEITNIVGRLELSADSGGYSYSFQDIGTVQTNFTDGETISFPARVIVPEGLMCTAVRDGKVYSLPQNGIISEDGSYSLKITAFLSTGASETRYLGFSLYSGAASRLGVYHPPYGYSIMGVTRSGEACPFSENHCRFTADGEYTVTYGNGSELKSVTLVRDTTPPVLYFNGGSGVVFSEAVTVTADSPCTITVEKNGMSVGSDTTLDGTGIYRITAVDKAGNVTSARVEIQAVSALNPMNFAVIFGALGIAALVYFIIQKNKGLVVR